MEALPITMMDIGIIAILLISGLLAFIRGFAKEMLSVGAWVGAALAALYAFPYVQPYARELISIPFAADAAAAVGVFIVTLIILSAITHWLAGHVRQSHFSSADRILGFLFGLVRGALVVCLLWLLYAWAVEPESRPKWVADSYSLPLIERGATLLASLVPEDMRERGAAAIEDVGDAARNAAETEAGRRLNPSGGEEAPATGGGTGYNPEQRRDMDKAIEENQ
jgi:membrane protein required for colicin V production